jgi:cell division protein FtsI/penicillin-binding protein 2
MLKKGKKRHPAVAPSAIRETLPKTRMYLVILVILFFTFAVILQLFKLQVKNNSKYVALAKKQHNMSRSIMPSRGEIFLRQKDEKFSVAINKELKTVFAIPKEIEDPALVAQKIASILELDEGDIIKKLSKKDDMYEVLKRRIPNELFLGIEKMELKGIYGESEYWRYYPGNSLAAHTLGFVGYKDDKLSGRYGIENELEKRLSGEEGMMEQERDVFGRWIATGMKSIKPQRDGQDVILTLENVLQFKAEEALKSTVERHDADSGKVIIINPKTGEILAMAAYPTFNLNEYSKVEDINVFRNALVSDQYECGSVFKPITMAIGLDTDKIRPDTTYIDTGVVVEAGFKIQNSDEKAYQKQTMTQVIEKSLNTGVIFVEKEIGNQEFFRYVEDFGFGKITGINFPGEASGNISNLKTNRDIEYFTASFGQGITLTPLQLVMAYGAMANGGDLLKPQIISSIIAENGIEKKIEVEKVRSVISEETSREISLMLESNVVNGHGKMAGVPGHRIAGKTGTAQIPDKEKGGYLEDATIGTFAGYGPVEDPIFAMVTIIDYPKDIEWAESTAAPIFGELAKVILDYYGIEPTEKYDSKDLEAFAKTHNYLLSEKEIEAEKEKKEKEAE